MGPFFLCYNAFMKYSLETSRLILRPWKNEDKEPFAQMGQDPEVMRFFPKLLSKDESDAMVDRLQGIIDEKGWGMWAVELKETGEFIGFTGLNIPRFEAHFTPCVEIGWRLKKEFWNKGYATEAARESLRFGFEILKLEEIVAMASKENAPSTNVMTKLGMTYDPSDDFDHPLIPNEDLKRCLLYRLENSSF